MDNLTPTEAGLILIALDVLAQYGWDGAPFQAEVASAMEKLSEMAGEVRPAALRVVE